MGKAFLLAITGCILMVWAGCAANPIVGHGTVQAGRYIGDVGVTGNGTLLTIQAGSAVSKLSIVGDGCRITVEDGATISKIEFWGNGNTVEVPGNLAIQIAAMGTNKVIQREAAASSETAHSSSTK